MIRVLIVDDHPIVHDGLTAVIHAEADVRVIGSSSTAADAIRKIEQEKPDVVLLDLDLPGEEGISGVERILSAAPGARVIVFTAYDVDDTVFGAMKAGARGYVIKGSPAPS